MNLIKKKFNFKIFYLYLLIPPALITGPFLPDLLLVIISLIYLIKIIIEKKYFYFNNKFCKIFLVFYLFLIISSLTSDNILLSLESTLFYFRYMFFSIATLYILNTEKNFIKYLLFSIALSILVLFLDAGLQWFRGENILGWEIKIKTRLTSFFGEEMILGSYLSRMYVLFVMCYFLIRKNQIYLDKIFLICGLIITIFFIFRTGERVALGYCIFLSIYLIIIFRDSIFVNFSIIISALLISIIAFFISPVIKDRMFSLTFYQIIDENKIYTISKFLPFSEHHEKHYITAIKMFIDKPITGHGPKLFREKCKNAEYFILDGCATHPHNSYIQLLSETGIIGFSFLFIFILYVLIKFIKSVFGSEFYNLTSRYNSVIYLPILLNFFPLFPTGSFFNNWLNVIYFIPIGFILWKNKLLKRHD
jgi:O-antigen ligase